MSVAEAIVWCVAIVCGTFVLLSVIAAATGGNKRRGARLDSEPPYLDKTPPNPFGAARVDPQPPRPDAPWRAPREGGYRGHGGAIPTSPPPGTSATSRGKTPPPPCGGSGQATARDEWHDWGSSSPDLSYMPRSFIRRWREKNL